MLGLRCFCFAVIIDLETCRVIQTSSVLDLSLLIGVIQSRQHRDPLLIDTWSLEPFPRNYGAKSTENHQQSPGSGNAWNVNVLGICPGSEDRGVALP